MTRMMMAMGIFGLVLGSCFLNASGQESFSLFNMDASTTEFSGQLLLINENTGNFVSLGNQDSTLTVDAETGGFIAFGTESTGVFNMDAGTTEINGRLVLINPSSGNAILIGSDDMTLMVNPETDRFMVSGNLFTMDAGSTEFSKLGPNIPGGVLCTPTGGLGAIQRGSVDLVSIPNETHLLVLHPENAASDHGSPLVLELYPTIADETE